MDYRQRLAKAVERGHVCVGIDPVPDRLPEPLKGKPSAVRTFVEEIVRAAAPHAAAFKPNLAFFEALGHEGDDALEAAVAAAREHAPHAVVIGDGKRGDIGSTAQRYAAALYDRWGFDAVTVNPWFGDDGVLPFTERPERGVLLLAATSNPSAAMVQELGAPEEPLYLRIAKLAESRWNEHGNVGLVVGATRGETMEAIRAAGSGLPWLIPGIGAQGGDLQTSVAFGMAGGAVPSLVNASRSIIYASGGEDYAEAAAREAKALRDAISKAVGGAGA